MLAGELLVGCFDFIVDFLALIRLTRTPTS